MPNGKNYHENYNQAQQPGRGALNIRVNDVSIIINEKVPKSKVPVSKKRTKNRIVEHLKQTVSWKKMI